MKIRHLYSFAKKQYFSPWDFTSVIIRVVHNNLSMCVVGGYTELCIRSTKWGCKCPINVPYTLHTGRGHIPSMKPIDEKKLLLGWSVVIFNIFFCTRTVVVTNCYHTISNTESFPYRFLRHNLLIIVAYFEEKSSVSVYPLSFVHSSLNAN